MCLSMWTDYSFVSMVSSIEEFIYFLRCIYLVVNLIVGVDWPSTWHFEQAENKYHAVVGSDIVQLVCGFIDCKF